jgi:hypothetical protein
MRRSLLFALMAVAVLCGCTSGGSGPTSSSSTSAPGCAFHTDTVERTSNGGFVNLQPLGHPKSAVTAARPLPCSATVTAASNGSAELRYANGAAARCQFYQDVPTETASLVSRDQPNDFLALAEGKVDCSWPAGSPHPAVHLCDVGTMLISGDFQGDAICHPEPFFQVAVLAGSVRVTAPGLDRTLEAGQVLTQHCPQPTAAQFSASDVSVLQAQAQAMGLPVTKAPQTITFTTTATNPVVGGTYVVQATGGNSGNQVIFTVDLSSGKACSKISANTFRFNLVATCTIDANQAGNALFLAAPQAQQPIPIASPSASPSPSPPG